MGLKDMFSRGGRKATLPRGAKVVRRQKKRGNGSDLGYWEFNTFYLLDGTMANSYEYEGGENSGEVLSTSEARAELSDAGYDAGSYTAPSTSSYNDGGANDSYRTGSAYDSTPPSSYDSSDRSSSYGGYSSGGGGYSSDSGSSGGYSSGGSSGGYSGGSDSSSSSSSSSSDSGSY